MKDMKDKYEQYYKDVSKLNDIDVYMTHQVFQMDDPSGCIQHASKKLLLSGVRTGGKSKADDIKEARDTLTRWLQINDAESEVKPKSNGSNPFNFPPSGVLGI
jgi:hypothetical protein